MCFIISQDMTLHDYHWCKIPLSAFLITKLYYGEEFMKLYRTILIVAISLLIMLFSSSTSPAAQASPLADPPQPPTIEQPERPIYEPLYFENHRLPGLLEEDLQSSEPEYTFNFSAAVVQNLDEHAARKYNYEIYYYDDYNNINLTNKDTADDLHAKLNRGSTQVVFVSDRSGNLELFRMNADGSNPTQLTWVGEPDVRPDWSPDSYWIVWESYFSGQAEIYIQSYNADYVTQLTQDEGFDGMPAWSPDGSKIAFISNRTGGYRVYTMNTDGSGLIQLSDQPYSVYPVWSPDGSNIAFSADSDSDGWLELWWMNADGSNEQLLYDSPEQEIDIIANAWAPNQPVIAYTHVNYIYAYGNWYWEAAYTRGWNYETGNYAGIYPTSRAWYLDWKTTDANSPISSIIEPSTNPQPYRFLVQWSGYDDKAGVKQYEVQYRIDAQGDWVDWILRPYYDDNFEWFEGSTGHVYYFRSRAYDWAENVEPWPEYYDLAVEIETSPPVTAINPLPRFTHQENVHFSWEGYDQGESGVQYFNIDKWDDLSQIWTIWFTSEAPTGAELYGVPGRTYRLRSWGVDWAGNIEESPFLGDTLTTFYNWMASGHVTDNTGTPVQGAEMQASLTPFLYQASDSDGHYLAYFSEELEEKAFTFGKNGYAELPASSFGNNIDNFSNFVLPPNNNVVQDWGFEEIEPSVDWNTGGVYTPSLDTSGAHSGAQAASLGAESAFSEPFGLDLKPYYEARLSTVIGQDHAFHIAEINYSGQTGIDYRQRTNDNIWLPVEHVYNTMANLENIAMAVDSHSVVHLVWQEYNVGVMYTSRNTTGTWSEPILISSGENAPLDMYVDMADTLYLLLSWGSSSFLYKPDGEPWSAPEDVPILDGCYNQMVVSPQGTVHILCRNAFLYYVQRSADGNWSDFQQITTRNAYDFKLILDSQGTPHAVWSGGQDEYTDKMEILYAYRKADSSWSSPYAVEAGVEFINGLAVGLDAQNNMHLAWAGCLFYNQFINDIYYQKKEAGGGWSHRVNISETSSASDAPSLALTPQGDVLIAWSESYDTDFSVYYTWIYDGIPGLPAPLWTEPGSYFGPRLSYDLEGSLHILWAIGDEYNAELYHMGTSYATSEGDSWIAQSLTLPISMTQPVLSFMYLTEGLTADGSQMEVLLKSQDVTTTLFSNNQNSQSWEHAWTDLSDWSGQEVTLTFQIKEVQGELLGSLKLDEVTIGQAHPDTWLSAEGDNTALPAEQFSLTLQYGNRGVVLAENSVLILTLTAGLSFVSAVPAPSLVDGDQVVWDLGDLAAGYTDGQIALILEMDSPGELGSWLTSQFILASQTTELELLNNQIEFKTYVGSLVTLPFAAK
jgi:TolB protein